MRRNIPGVKEGANGGTLGSPVLKGGGPLRAPLSVTPLRGCLYPGTTDRRSFWTPLGTFRRSLTVLFAGTLRMSVPTFLDLLM